VANKAAVQLAPKGGALTLEAGSMDNLGLETHEASPCWFAGHPASDIVNRSDIS